MFPKTCVFLLVILLGIATSSCSGVATSKAGPSCGDEIDQHNVLVLDLQSLATQPDLFSEFLAKRIGAYRLVTTEPIGIPKSNRKFLGSGTGYVYAEPSSDSLEGIGQAKIEAAMRGCELLLVLESRVVTHPGQYNKPAVDTVWIVHMGEREDPLLDSE